MEIIKNNPYRIAGILSNASERELQKQKTKIRAFSKVGKEIKSDFDFDVLGNITRTEDLIDKAFSNVEQNQDKVNFSLFWFLNASPFDNTAFEYLKNGNDEKADEIWKKVTQNKEVNSKNFSAFSNLGTYKLLSESQDDIKDGIDAKVKLIESDFFKNFVHTVADETFTIDSEKQIEKLIDELLMQFKNQYSSTETLQLFSNCNDLIQKYLSKKFTEEPIHNIESLIESTKNKRKKNKSDAYQYGLNLANKCKAELILLHSLIGTTDLKYKTVADQLANEIMQCGIDYFNKSKEDNASNNYLQSAQKLTKIADSIAVGKLTKERAQDSLATLEEMKDRELSQAIDVLESIKSAYENNAVQLMAQVKKQEASMGYGQSINWSKVTEMIMNSIDWDKATELIIDVIPKENIVKIKNSQNTSKINDYKKLVDFILGKLGYSHKIKVKYLQYWESTRIATTATRTSSTRTASTPQSTENEGIPDWLKWVGGIILFILLLKACN